jgi:hypothetical protein
MDIASVSMDMAQAGVQEQVGTTMLAKSLKGAEEQGAEILKLLGSAAPLPEGSGRRIDLFV